MPHADEKVATFLRRALFVEHDAGPCVRVKLCRIIAGQGETVLSNWKMPTEPKGFDVETCAADIVRYAQSDADSYGGANRYVVVGLFGTEGRPEAASPAFLLRATPRAEPIFEESDPPTRVGQLSQGMRHTEAMARIYVAGIQQVQTQLQEQNRALSEENQRYRDGFLKQVKETEELASQRHERELATKRQEIELEQRAALWRHAQLLMPAIINHVTGKKILPEGVLPTLDLALEFFATIQPDQLSAAMTIFPDSAQKTAIMQLYEVAKKEIRARDEARAMLAAPSPSSTEPRH